MPPKHHRDARKTQRTLTFRVWFVDVVNGKNRCSSAGAVTNKRNSPHRTTARRINSKQRRRRFLSRQNKISSFALNSNFPHCDFYIRQTPLRYHQYRTTRRRLRNSLPHHDSTTEFLCRPPWPKFLHFPAAGSPQPGFPRTVVGPTRSRQDRSDGAWADLDFQSLFVECCVSRLG